MSNILILIIGIGILFLLFLIIFFIIGKNKINEIIIPLDISKEQINEYLKDKYKLYKKIINFMKDNLNIKEDAFKEFLDFNANGCTQGDLIHILDKTTFEINDYLSNYDELLSNKDFLNLKNNLYYVQIDLEATIDYYHEKIKIYEDRKDSGPTGIVAKFFQFDDYDKIDTNRKEISKLIRLN